MRWVWLFICLLVSPVLMACICLEFLSFKDVTRNADLVALVKIDRFQYVIESEGMMTPLAMDIRLLETYKGNIQREKVRVWGNNGTMCSPYIYDFDTTQTYVLALQHVSNEFVTRWYFSNKLGMNQGTQMAATVREYRSYMYDYTITNCGDAWLRVENDTVRGFLDGPSLERPGVPMGADRMCLTSEIEQYIHFSSDTGATQGTGEQSVELSK